MEDTCVCCGAPVPEGRMVCWTCQRRGEERAAELWRRGEEGAAGEVPRPSAVPSEGGEGGPPL